MNRFNRIRKKYRKTAKRVLSFFMSLLIVVCSLQLPVFNDVFNAELKAETEVITYYPAFNAESSEKETINSKEMLANYSSKYAANPAAHINDTIVLAYSDMTGLGEVEGFTPIGTQDYPFGGKIKIASGMMLNLPTEIFAYITDGVQIVDNANNVEDEVPATLVLSRTRETNDTPLFARQVVPAVGSQGANWSLQYARFRNNNNNNIDYSYKISGFIGTLGAGAKVKLASLIFDNQGTNTTGNIISVNLDAGLACCTMGAGAILEIDSVSQTSECGTNEYVVSSNSGHAGGLVGSMGESSKLILGAGIVNPQASSQTITSASGYAGGIVGYCNGGTIKFNNAYTVSQVISGALGAGGMCGYYNTTATAVPDETYNRYAISSSVINVSNSCKINGSGNCGGLFGTLVNDGDMTIEISTAAISPDHSAGAAVSLGGLIGDYSATALSDSLTISTSGSVSVSPSKSGGSANQYGGIIGVVSSASYVKVDGVTVSSSNALAEEYFGGVVGKAETSFIEMSGTNTISFSGISASNSFAGIIGNLKDGVLYLQGTTDLSGTPSVSSANESSGQIVGYRDYGLIFADKDWSLTRSSNTQILDDVGSWGEVVRFDASKVKQEDILTINDMTGEDHYVTLGAAISEMESTSDFVRTALNIQLNKGQSDGVLRCAAGTTSLSILGRVAVAATDSDPEITAVAATALSLKDSTTEIDLSGTGITGLTRDNGAECITYTGTFNGNSGTIKLATGEPWQYGSKTEGNGKIYRHKYNGLFGKTSGATIQNLNVSDESSINIQALSETTYIGNLVGEAEKNLTISAVEVKSDTTTDPDKYATIVLEGSATSYVGGFVGGISSIGTVSISDSTFSGFIDSSSTAATIGGIIGNVSGDAFTTTIADTTVSGKISSSASGNSVGGTIGVIGSSNTSSSSRKLRLNDVSISGLEMDVMGTSGGFLGHTWYKTDVEFKQSGDAGVTLEASSSLTSAGNTAGLVHTATGYWKVNTGGIDLKSLSVTANSATSFGLLVNTGRVTNPDSAIYLELAPNSFSVTKDDVVLTLPTSGIVFDELVAYSAVNNLFTNGQGIVSIATDANHSLLKMGASDTNTGSTYQHKTKYLDDNPTLRNNPNTRYYYNLDAYKSGELTNAQQLLMWSVYRYAHSTIQSNFIIGNVSTLGSDITDSFNMRGYSYYPINLSSGTLSITGTITLYNTDFDATETGTTDNRLSSESAQHYMIHNSLLRDVNGTLTANVKFAGEVSKIGDYCGALIMGTVSSKASASPATVNINGFELAGIKIKDAAGPLLINKAGSNATINVSNVFNDSTSYTSMGAGASTPTFIATSLLGDIGSSSSTQVKLTFSGIKLDGRKNATSVSNLSGLTDIYHSTGSLFSNATLVNKLSYVNDDSSFGVYNYTYDEDWGGTVQRKVTYGAEIDSTEENKDSNNVSMQKKYNQDNAKYTNPTTNTGVEYGQFARDFQKYVSTAYNVTNKTHELRVNIPGNTDTEGCGTYDEPYIIKTGMIFNMYASVINGANTDSQTISVPTGITDASHENVSWCGGDHIVYTTYSEGYWYDANHTEETKLSNDRMREYLAGAYYKVKPSVTGANIVLPSGFNGISAAVQNQYVFRGVIDGNGNTIENPTTNPLIVSSNGSVVKNLTIEVTATTTKDLSMTASLPFLSDGVYNSARCEFYGAVIGQIFGGDNIIDGVSVAFPDNAIIKANTNNSKNMAFLVPIGGYVGVVINGGLIFRNMDGLSTSNQAGITKKSLQGFTCTITKVVDDPSTEKNEADDGDPTSSEETQWLYVNPIIGRVLNGYAITESDAYRPFENGDRTYPDGTTKFFWHETKDGNGKVTGVYADANEADKVGVTMHNGTKNYSIADINKNDTTNNFTMTKDNVTSGNEDATVTVTNAQALFIISLITESGLATSKNCKYDNANNLLQPYGAYMATHLADYDKIGTTTATADSNKALKDVHYTGDLTKKVPYLIKTYTPEISTTVGENTEYTYPAFNLAAYKGSSKTDELYLNMSFSGGSNTTYFMPDGFRGLGCLLFGTGTNNSWSTSTKVFNAMFLKNLDGANKNISLNMSLRIYSADDNYHTPTQYQARMKTGFGFFNALRSTGGASDGNQLKNLTLSGSVVYELINSSNGSEIGYQEAERPAVGGFIGAPGVDTNTDGGGGDMWLSNIILSNIYVKGARYAGGFMGCSNSSSTYTFYNCSADKLEVIGGSSAGGLIGYIRHASSKIDVKNTEVKKYGIINVKTVTNAVLDGDKGNNSAGGLFGCSYVDTTGHVKVVKAKIKNATGFTTGYVGGASGFTTQKAGGVVGSIDRNCNMTMQEVTVENINVKSGKSGGLIGSVSGNSPITIDKCTITTTQNSVIESINASGVTTCGSGGLIGYSDVNNASATLLVNNESIIQNYAIFGDLNCGGIIGNKNSSNSPQIICRDFEINGVKIKVNQRGGALVGHLQNGAVFGYNILVQGTTFESYTSGADMTHYGYVVGKNETQVIKLAGYSRQGTITTANMVGNSESVSNENYGENGYIIFADYKNSGSNNKFSNIKETGSNVGSVGDHMDVLVGSYKYATDLTGAISGEKQDVQSFVPGSSETYDASIGTNPVSFYSGIEYKYVPNTVSSVSDLIPVTSFSELTEDKGFYLWSNAGNGYITIKNMKNGKPSPDTNGALPVIAFNSSTQPEEWFFHVVNAQEHTYNIYIKRGGDSYYLKNVNDTTEDFFLTQPLTIDQSEAAVFKISDASAENTAWNNAIEANNLANKYKITDLGFYANSFYFKKAAFAGGIYNDNKDGKPILTNYPQFLGSYLQWNSGRNSYRYYTNHYASGQISKPAADRNYDSNRSAAIKILNVPSGLKLQAKEYSSITIADGVITPGSIVETRDATPDEISTFNRLCSSDEMVLYDITETIKQNKYVDGENLSPYVTTNPKVDIVKSGNTSIQWLTSDGVSSTAYASSSAYSIISETTNKKYQSTGLTVNQINHLSTTLDEKMKSIKQAVTASPSGYNGEDFPVLVIDDLSSADSLVKNYLKLLTNTNYDFTKGYSKGNTTQNAERYIFNVSISKWKYNFETDKFELQDGEASLKCTANDRFRINATELDNENWQISLIDVQFYDPNHIPTIDAGGDITEEGWIAYHLYVPVVVKKMLYYSVSIRPASTTTYNLNAYPKDKCNLLENLGNPVTMKVTYTYQQNAAGWEDAINGGESVTRNYDKILSFQSYGNLFPDDAIIVLVDPNNDADKYYYRSFKEATVANNGVITDGIFTDGSTDSTARTYKLDLSSFDGFMEPQLNDLMTISLDTSETATKNLTWWTEGDIEPIVAYLNDENDTINCGKPLRMARSGETDRVAVKVALKSNQASGGWVQENYYISIFTNADKTNTNIYHYVVESYSTNFGDSAYPSAEVGTHEAPNLFLGKLYSNNVTIQENDTDAVMSESKLTISADLTATVGFTTDAINNNIVSYIENNQNISIYQNFMLGLNRLNGEGEKNQRGILVSSIGVTPSNYKINGTAPDSSKYNLTYDILKSYVDLGNGYNIKDALVAAVNDTANTNNVITIKETVTIGYSSGSLSTQFPKSTAELSLQGKKGTYMIGYSNISSTSTGGAASRASANTDADSGQRLLYYMEDDTSVEFSYNAIHNDAFNDDGNGNYGQLGLDGNELDVASSNYVSIQTAAYYNIHEYNRKNEANYIMLTIKLSKKDDGYEEALYIPTYLSEFKIFDKNGHEIVQVNDDPETTEENESNDTLVTKNAADNIYVYIIPKGNLKETSDEYYIPISFSAYSGNNAAFEGKNDASNDMQYSNYKVLVTVGLLADKNDTTPLNNSDAFDHVIYTNAKLLSEVLE